MSDLRGKVALVTGGASGIGRASAIAYAKSGANVMVADRPSREMEQVVDELRALGISAHAVEVDVSDSELVERMVASTIGTFGRIDCAFNNAGIVENANVRIADMEEDEWDRVIDVNLKGVWLCMKHEIRHFLASGSGNIVNIASIAGVRGAIFGAAYPASKPGVAGLTRAAALQYAEDGIRVNAVAPGIIRTAMLNKLIAASPGFEETRTAKVPMKRFGQPKEVADAVVWLSSDESSYITGQVLGIDGGWLAR